MHVYPARVITPDRVWTPTTACEGRPGEFIIDSKNRQRLATVTEAEWTLAPEDKRTALGTERLWILTGNVDGEPIEWAIMQARGCGCGDTQHLTPTDTDQQVFV